MNITYKKNSMNKVSLILGPTQLSVACSRGIITKFFPFNCSFTCGESQGITLGQSDDGHIPIVFVFNNVESIRLVNMVP